MKPYTEEEKMHNYVQYIKNELDDAYIELSDARSNLESIAKRYRTLSGTYAESLAQTIEGVQMLIESIKKYQVEDNLESYVEEEFPIEEEEE